MFGMIVFLRNELEWFVGSQIVHSKRTHSDTDLCLQAAHFTVSSVKYSKMLCLESYSSTLLSELITLLQIWHRAE